MFGRRRLDILVEKQGNVCAYCAEPFGTAEQEANPTIDHVIPECRGGTRADDNVVAACARCNHAKGDQPAEHFRYVIATGHLRPRRDLTNLGQRLRVAELKEAFRATRPTLADALSAFAEKIASPNK